MLCYVSSDGIFEAGLKGAKFLQDRLGEYCFAVSNQDMGEYNLDVEPILTDAGWRGSVYGDSGKEISMYV